jgi:hypothetical protein
MRAISLMEQDLPMMNLEEGSGELVSYLSFFWFAEICVATY